MTNSKKKVALVIGSGGIKCAAAIGVWRVLKELDLMPDIMVGCSGGSIYAATIALDYSIELMEEMTLNFWTSEIMKDYTSNLKATQDGSLRFNERSGLVDDSFMNARLQDTFGERTFSDAKIPLHIVATDMKKGEKVELVEGSLFNAIRASIAIPIIFPPWEIDGKLLIDGAASNPMPVDVAIREGAEIIIAMGFKLAYRKRMRSMTAVQSQLTNIYMNNILQSNFAFYNLAHHAEIIPLIPEFESSLSMFDVDRIPEIIEKGAELAREEVPYIKRMLDA